MGMSRLLLASALALALCIQSAAIADADEQPLPSATLHVGGMAQKGRLGETTFNQPADGDLCVSQNELGDGSFPHRLHLGAERARLRFRVNAESRPKVSLRYWESRDHGAPEGESIKVPIAVEGRKPNGDWLLTANLDLSGKRFMSLSAFWKGTDRCHGQEFLRSQFAADGSTLTR